jgi:hypothetical protein
MRATRVPVSLADASAAFAAIALLREALREGLHGSPVDSQAAERHRCGGCSDAALVAAEAWRPLVGGLCWQGREGPQDAPANGEPVVGGSCRTRSNPGTWLSGT